MLADDEVNRYLLKVFRQIAVAVGESYSAGVLHAYSFLGNKVSWYDVKDKTAEITDRYFERLVAEGKGYGDLDLSKKYAEMKAILDTYSSAEPIYKDIQDYATEFKTIIEQQSIFAYRDGEMNTYIENGIEYVKLKCSNEWCESYEKHNDAVFKIGTEPSSLASRYCAGDYRPYHPAVTDLLNAEKVKNFTKKESDIMAETDEKINRIMDEAEKAVLRIMKIK